MEFFFRMDAVSLGLVGKGILVAAALAVVAVYLVCRVLRRDA